MKRLESLDALRGFDMVWIIGLEWTVRGFFKMFPCGQDLWLERQFHHVPWDGLAFYDTIFPLFIFIAGVSFPFSYARQLERGWTPLKVHFNIVRRCVLLVLLGMVYNGILAFDFDGFRYASVLGKIGIAWAAAALLYVHLGIRARVVALVAFFLGYWVLLHCVAPDAPAGAGSFTLEGCFPGYLDRIGFTPGRLYCKGLLDPSGTVVSALGSSTTAMMGMFAGDMLKDGALTQLRKAIGLSVAGLVALVAGLLVSIDCPIIKNLWTPSYSLVVGGYSFLMLSIFYWIIDVRGWRSWCVFLEVVGLNSITIYLLKRIVDYKSISHFLFGGIASWMPDAIFVESLGVFVLCWLTCWFLHRHKIYLKV